MLNSLNQRSFHPQTRTEKPLELYLFFNPLNESSWELERIIRKVKTKYAPYFKLRYVLHLEACISCDKQEGYRTIFYAIKAAELQGHRLGTEFIQRLFDHLYLAKETITNQQTLLEIASQSGLDMNEFQLDLASTITEKAYLCDRSIAAEMDVTQSPSLVFFNRYHEEEGLKIEGLHSLDIYQHIFRELLQNEPITDINLSIEQCIRLLRFSNCDEIARLLNISEKQVTCELKKLCLQNKVRKTITQQGILWKIN
ncbi:DsbA family protein [Brochothrix campestris]|uniref:Dithiol-disulfide isomerase n=1 Tax=Brochothrix campestris FSL F6-1037 TaxID=1265861 RepID=W7CRL2_9LIST|nr:DsbA family protein [Brochothrix campestris]EUJ39265.1 hypothetical protein BCAMP_07715 [Brochothrix campestris FSL F6-1037]